MNEESPAIPEVKIYVVFTSHRAREQGQRILGLDSKNPEEYYSRERETGYGCYLLTQGQIDKLKAAEFTKWRKLRGPFDDIHRCWS